MKNNAAKLADLPSGTCRRCRGLGRSDYRHVAAGACFACGTLPSSVSSTENARKAAAAARAAEEEAIATAERVAFNLRFARYVAAHGPTDVLDYLLAGAPDA